MRSIADCSEGWKASKNEYSFLSFDDFLDGIPVLSYKRENIQQEIKSECKEYIFS